MPVWFAQGRERHSKQRGGVTDLNRVVRNASPEPKGPKMAIAAPKSYDTSLGELLEGVTKGTHQLPEFQRSWTWDDRRIRNIIASLTQGYPMGALMRLECGGSEVRLKYRAFEGTHGISREPDYLVLDGQQRLTSLYCSLFGKDPVSTSNERGQKLSRFYYLLGRSRYGGTKRSSSSSRLGA